MTTLPAELTDHTMLDFESLPDLAQRLAPSYQHASPFPHVVLDDFLSAHWSRAIANEVPAPSANKHWRSFTVSYADGDTSQTGKLGLQQEQQLPALVRELLWEMNSAEFLRFLETLTGIDGLIADPRFNGGGIHQVLPGGHLGVHADFTQHRVYGLSRRLNVLLYLNENWQAQWGGHLELWQRDLSACARRVMPLAGRCVVFSTDATSYHGHPDPLACPEGVTRKSLALYYYTQGRSEDIAPVVHTDWQKTSRHHLPEPQ